MSELQAHYEMMNTGCWATSDAEDCPCHGNGWALSEVDTWHKCPVHFQGQLHPEACESFEDEDEYTAAQEASMAAFAAFQVARKAGTFRGTFDSFQAASAARTVSTLPAPASEVGEDEIPF